MEISKEETLKRLRDPKFYLENFCRIKGKLQGSLIPFVLNEAQKDLFNTLKKYSRILINKGRQLGTSTGAVGWIYHNTITNPGTTSALIGYNTQLTAELLDKVKTLYQSTPDELKPTIHYNSRWEISFPKINSKILVIAAGDSVGRGFTLNNVLCVSGEIEVFIENGFTKKVKDIKDGDFILNGRGGLAKVKMVIKKKNDKNLLRIKIVGNNDLVVTEDHEILVRGSKLNGYKHEWKKASDLTNKDRIGYPHFQCRNRNKTIKIPNIINEDYLSRSNLSKVNNVINIDYNFGLFIGWYLAEGNIKKNVKKDFSGVQFSIHKDEVDEVLGVIEKSVKKNVGKISVYYSKKSKTAVINLYDKNFSKFIYDIFGDGSLNKIINDCIWYWNTDFAYGLLAGLFKGNGYLKKTNRSQLISINKQLIYQVKKLLISLRIGMPNINHHDTNRYGVKNQHRYDLILGGKSNYKFRKKLNFELPIYDNGRGKWLLENLPNVNQGHGTSRKGRYFFWSKINKIEKSDHEEYVYDIVMDKSPHSFLTVSGVVHNCTELPQWENAEEKLIALEASVPISGKLIIESTPMWVGDLFHRLWVTKDNGYVKKEYGWWWGYSFEEKEIIKKRMNNPIKFGREYELKFLSTGLAVFDTDKIQGHFKNILKVGDSVKNEDGSETLVEKYGDWVIYKKPNPTHFYSVGCLPDGEKVLTNSGLKNIEDINFNDKLIDANGKIVKIKNIQRRYYEGKIIEIKPNYTSFCTKFTPEHPILVLKDNKLYREQKKISSNYGERYYKTDTFWKIAKDLTENDICKIPIRFKKELSKNKILKRFSKQKNVRIDRRLNPNIILEEDFWFFIGLWLAEGWTTQDIIRNDRIINTYGVTIHLNALTEKFLVNKILKVIKKYFNRNVNYRVKQECNVIDIKFNSEVIHKFINDNFGQKAKNKDIKEWIKYLPANLKMALFNGYRTGDGCESMQKNGLSINCVSISEKLLYDFQEILLSMDIISAVGVLRKEGYHTINDRKCYCQKTFQLNISVRDSEKILNKNNKFFRKRHKRYGWIKDGFLYVKIGRIKKVYYNGFVNNFETETHSYQSPFLITHNCDVAEGLEGGDFSCAVIWDRTTGEEVAFYHRYIPPDVFAKELNTVGRLYNNALMVVEINNHGLTVVSNLKQLLYPNFYFRLEKYETIGMTSSDRIGWKTNKMTRPVLIDEFDKAFREDLLLIHSKELLDEMIVFIYDKNGDMNATPGYKDDSIFAAAIGWQGFKVTSAVALEQLDYNSYLPKSYAY
jgi:hypothetical protein